MLRAAGLQSPGTKPRNVRQARGCMRPKNWDNVGPYKEMYSASTCLGTSIDGCCHRNAFESRCGVISKRVDKKHAWAITRNSALEQVRPSRQVTLVEKDNPAKQKGCQATAGYCIRKGPDPWHCNMSGRKNDGELPYDSWTVASNRLLLKRHRALLQATRIVSLQSRQVALPARPAPAQP